MTLFCPTANADDLNAKKLRANCLCRLRSITQILLAAVLLPLGFLVSASGTGLVLTESVVLSPNTGNLLLVVGLLVLARLLAFDLCCLRQKSRG